MTSAMMHTRILAKKMKDESCTQILANRMNILAGLASNSENQVREMDPWVTP